MPRSVHIRRLRVQDTVGRDIGNGGIGERESDTLTKAKRVTALAPLAREISKKAIAFFEYLRGEGSYWKCERSVSIHTKVRAPSMAKYSDSHWTKTHRSSPFVHVRSLQVT